MPYADDLDAAFTALRKTAEAVAATDNINLMLANATAYLDAFGHVVVAWLWLKHGDWPAQKGLENGTGDTGFYQGKLAACRYFFQYELPGVYARFTLVASLDDTCLTMDPAHFTGD